MEFEVLDSQEVPGGLDLIVSPRPGTDPKTAFARVAKELMEYNLVPKLLKTRDGRLYLLVRTVRRPKPLEAWKSLISLAISLVTVWISGWLMSQSLLDLVSRVDVQFISSLGRSLRLINPVFFVIPLFSILGIHEFGHMLATKRWGGEWEPPIFIPGPPPLGTFGAVIRSGKIPINRDEIFDLGFSGPLSGFLPAVVMSVIGILTSPLIPIEEALQLAKEEGLQFVPTPLLFDVIQRLLSHPEGMTIIMSPIAFAGWVGLVLTFLNLLPAGQLDGGHVAYALLPNPRARLALGVAAVILAVPYSPLMALLIAFFMLTKHPPPLDEVSPLSTSRKVAGLAAYILLLILTSPLSI